MSLTKSEVSNINAQLINTHTEINSHLDDKITALISLFSTKEKIYSAAFSPNKAYEAFILSASLKNMINDFSLHDKKELVMNKETTIKNLKEFISFLETIENEGN